MRRICRILQLNRAAMTYKSRRVDDPILRARIKEIALTRYKYGMLRIQALLRREGWLVNHKRRARIYREKAYPCGIGRQNAGVVPLFEWSVPLQTG